MTRREFAKVVAKEHGVSQKAADAWCAAIFESLGNAILDVKIGEEISMYGFGRFRKLQSAARQGKLPNGEFVAIPPRPRIKFYPGIYLRYAINDNLNSEEYAERKEIIQAMHHGAQIPGYRLSGKDILKKVDPEEMPPAIAEDTFGEEE